MKTIEKAIATFTLKIDYTDAVQQALDDGEFTTEDEIKDFLSDWICDDIARNLLDFTNILEDVTWEIEGE